MDLDRITPLSMSILKTEKTRDLITDLQVPNTNPLEYKTQSGDMAELAANYHSQIQQDTVNANTRNQATQNALIRPIFS